MAASDKRLDLRFGAFACSVQGFDDPVMPVQQILRAIQTLLEESPEIADAGISFDAETIESLIQEVSRRADVETSDLEITPGLIIIYHGEGSPPDLSMPAETAARPVPAPEAADESDDDGDDEAGAVEDSAVSDIFSSRLKRSLFDEPEDAETEAPGPEPDDEPAGAKPAPAAPRDIFAPPPDTGPGVFADPFAEAGEGGAEGAAADDPGRGAGDAELPEIETGPPAGGDEAPAGGINLFGNFLTGGDYQVEPGAEAAEAADEEDSVLELGTGEAPGTGDDPHTVAGITKLAGATSVPEMMVCAAAWMVLLKGQTTFTRREVMDVFDQIPGDHPKTLEARIKGFGKAVRNQQIVMVEEGTFGLSGGEIERFQALL